MTQFEERLKDVISHSEYMKYKEPVIAMNPADLKLMDEDMIKLVPSWDMVSDALKTYMGIKIVGDHNIARLCIYLYDEKNSRSPITEL